MSALSQDISPLGDLYILIGQGEEQKLVRVSKAILSIASPVFYALLSPNFKEGNDINDKSSPLKLPEDDPTAITNLFLIMHWKTAELDKRKGDWLQKLISVCDKYQCIAKFADFFKGRMQDGTLANLDKLHVAAHLGDRERFASISELLVRLPKHEVKNQLHADLLQLLPENCLEILVAYHELIRTEHQNLVQKLKCGILGATADSDKLCYGLRERYIAFSRFVYKHSIKLADTTTDVELVDVNVLRKTFCGPCTNVDLLYACSKTPSGCKCSYRVKTAIEKALEEMKGVNKQSSLCLNCFIAGVSMLEQDCGEHSVKKPVILQSNKTTANDTAT